MRLGEKLPWSVTMPAPTSFEAIAKSRSPMQANTSQVDVQCETISLVHSCHPLCEGRRSRIQQTHHPQVSSRRSRHPLRVQMLVQAPQSSPLKLKYPRRRRNLRVQIVQEPLRAMRTKVCVSPWNIPLDI